MKVRIDSDEWYPYYFEAHKNSTYCEGTIEMTADEYADWQETDRALDRWHKVIRERLEK